MTGINRVNRLFWNNIVLFVGDVTKRATNFLKRVLQVIYACFSHSQACAWACKELDRVPSAELSGSVTVTGARPFSDVTVGVNTKPTYKPRVIRAKSGYLLSEVRPRSTKRRFSILNSRPPPASLRCSGLPPLRGRFAADQNNKHSPKEVTRPPALM